MKVLRIFLIACILCLFPYTIYGFGVYDLEQNNEVEIVDYSVLSFLEEANVENYQYLIDNNALLLRKSGVVENEFITREDFLTMFFRLMTDYRYHEVSESPYYIDVNVRDWYAGYVEWARYNGVARGYGNDVWGIGDYLTVEQMCKMVHGYVEFNDFALLGVEDKFNYLYETYLKDNNHNIYLSIIPDKNYFMVEDDYLKLDYELLVETMKSNTSYMEYIDIFDLLSLQDYYHTDTHWRQENIIDISNRLTQKMGFKHNETQYTHNILTGENELPYGFKGVYTGQYGLPTNNDMIYYLTSDIIDNCIVTSLSSGKPQEIDMYSFNKAYGKDSYEMFLNGTEALITIENPNANTDKELILFRDSFGSSLAPLLVQNYSKITLVDIRYMDSKLIGNFIEFDGQDVLFLYSTILLNNSSAFK